MCSDVRVQITEELFSYLITLIQAEMSNVQNIHCIIFVLLQLLILKNTHFGSSSRGSDFMFVSHNDIYRYTHCIVLN